MKIIGYILARIVIMVYAAMMDGLAISKLWSWFIVTTFGLPALTITEAIGLAMVVIYITTKPDDKNNEDTYFEKLFKGAVIATIKPLFAIGIGAIVKLWI